MFVIILNVQIIAKRHTGSNSCLLRTNLISTRLHNSAGAVWNVCDYFERSGYCKASDNKNAS
jgi:hypothetical protein